MKTASALFHRSAGAPLVLSVALSTVTLTNFILMEFVTVLLGSICQNFNTFPLELLVHLCGSGGYSLIKQT